VNETERENGTHLAFTAAYEPRTKLTSEVVNESWNLFHFLLPFLFTLRGVPDSGWKKSPDIQEQAYGFLVSTLCP
jgi:hypothetical protein